MIGTVKSYRLLQNITVTVICIAGYTTMACNADPGACNCVQNSMKVLSNDFDEKLFDQCESYVKGLSHGEAIEYSKKMIDCSFK